MSAEQKAREIVNGLFDTIECVDGDTMNWEGIIATALLEAEAAAYERAAQVADNFDYHSPNYPSVPRNIATAIRALKTEGT